MLEIAFVFLVVAAVRGLVEQTGRDLDKWKKRPPKPRGPGALSKVRGALSRVSAGGTGYWGHQAVHGFPSARAGLHDGWQRGGEAHHQARLRLAQGRAEHAEGKAELHPQLEELRERRRKALEALEAQQSAQEQAEQEAWSKAWEQGKRDRARRLGDAEPEEAGPDEEPQPASEPDDPAQTESETASEEEHPYGQPPPYKGYLDEDGNLVPPKWPDQPEEPAQSEYEQETQTTCAKCPVPPDGYELAVCPHGNEEPARPGQQDPGGNEKGEAVTNSSGETTYAGVKARMTAAIAAAEQRQAEAAAAAAACDERVQEVQQAKVWAENTADQMQTLEVDAATLGEMAGHLAALDKAFLDEVELQEVANRVKADWDQVVESAQSVSAQLDSSGHGGVQEARDNAAGGGAKKEFYEEG